MKSMVKKILLAVFVVMCCGAVLVGGAWCSAQKDDSPCTAVKIVVRDSMQRQFVQADEFAEVLSQLDEVVLLPIYPAREKPIEGVTSEWLMGKISAKKALVLPGILAKYLRERVKNLVAKSKDCVVITMGAGDVDRQVNDIKKALQI